MVKFGICCGQDNWLDLIKCFPCEHFINIRKVFAKTPFGVINSPPYLEICPQQIDSLIHSNLADIVVELLMTLYEGCGADGDTGDLKRFTG